MAKRAGRVRSRKKMHVASSAVITLASISCLPVGIGAESGGAPSGGGGGSEYSVELVRRNVADRLDSILGGPVGTADRLIMLRSSGFFPSAMGAADRDQIWRWMYSEVTVNGVTTSYGLENGLFLGLHGINGVPFLSYREPGDSGYPVTNVETIPADKLKYWGACVNETEGGGLECRMGAGDLYGKLELDDETGEPVLEECPGSNDDEEELETTESDAILCRRYTIETVSEGEDLGHVPWQFYCMGEGGPAVESPEGSSEMVRLAKMPSIGFKKDAGEEEDGSEDGNSEDDLVFSQCTFGDETTPVARGGIRGDYAYCGGEGASCNGTYAGAYRSLTYDPRYRAWYTKIRDGQRAEWSDIFATVPDLNYITTYSSPLYSYIEGENGTTQKVFEGVFNTDVLLFTVHDFILEEYGPGNMEDGDDGILVAIVEERYPNKLVAISSRKDVTDERCRFEIPANPDDCRLNMTTLGIDNDKDALFADAFRLYKERGFPEGGARSDVFLTRCDSGNSGCRAYSIQGMMYRGPNLAWWILTLAPVRRVGSDYISPSDPHAVAFYLVAGLGAGLCLLMLALCESSRRSQGNVMIAANIQFLRWILVASSLANVSSFVLLGDNTTTMCIVRMWSIHMSIAMTISPLFVKIWRIHRIVESSQRMRRLSMSFRDSVPYIVPIVLLQASILAAFTAFVRREEEFTYREDIIPEYRIVCGMGEGCETAFWSVEIAYYSILLGTGCVLAFLTRNLDPPFGEARQLLFALYNIAIIFILVGLVPYLLGLDAAATRLSACLGIFWGTVVSAGAFVMPNVVALEMPVPSPTDQSSAMMTRRHLGTIISRISLRTSRIHGPVRSNSIGPKLASSMEWGGPSDKDSTQDMGSTSYFAPSSNHMTKRSSITSNRNEGTGNAVETPTPNSPSQFAKRPHSKPPSVDDGSSASIDRPSSSNDAQFRRIDELSGSSKNESATEKSSCISTHGVSPESSNTESTCEKSTGETRDVNTLNEIALEKSVVRRNPSINENDLSLRDRELELQDEGLYRILEQSQAYDNYEQEVVLGKDNDTPARSMSGRARSFLKPKTAVQISTEQDADAVVPEAPSETQEVERMDEMA